MATMTGKYALVDKMPILIDDVIEWARVAEQRWQMIADQRLRV